MATAYWFRGTRRLWASPGIRTATVATRQCWRWLDLAATITAMYAFPRALRLSLVLPLLLGLPLVALQTANGQNVAPHGDFQAPS
jgi:hypothetical protein